MATKGKQTITKQDINLAIVDSIKSIMSIGHSTKGNGFDKQIYDILKQKFKKFDGVRFLETSDWSNNKIYSDYRNRCKEYNFDFNHLNDIIDNGEAIDLLVIDKPNGSQKWPDIMIVFNKIGMPFEIKSSQQDLITWNSGIPRDNGIYIFNCYGKGKTTVFLGQHSITSEERKILLNISNEGKKLNQLVSGNSDWSYYCRDMFVSKKKYFPENEKQNELQKKELELIKLNDEFSNCISEKKMESLLVKITDLEANIEKLNKEIDLLVKNREIFEDETINHIKTFKWDLLISCDYADDIEKQIIKSRKP